MDFDAIKDMLPFLIPILFIQLALLVFALVDLVKRKRVKGGNKILWGGPYYPGRYYRPYYLPSLWQGGRCRWKRYAVKA